MNSSKVDIEKRLEEILKRKVGTCIVLDGEWGVGKTTFWKNFSNEKFKENSVYVSLFGKESIQEIKQEIGIQIYKRNKYIKEIEKSKADQIFNLAMPNLGSALIGCISFFKKEDFKDTVICFDDFERISDKLNLKDIFGLISEYKEQQNCHIVMILNRSKMTTFAKNNQNECGEDLEDQESESNVQEDKNKIELEKILSEYKDKIMDYEFYYNPTPEESFSIVSSELKEVYRDVASQYFAKHDINNIRVMRRAINALNDYHKYLEDVEENHKKTRECILMFILGISVINSMNSLGKLEQFFGIRNFYGELEDIYGLFKNKGCLSNIDALIFSKDVDYHQLSLNIFSYVRRSIIDVNEFKKIVGRLIEREQFEEAKNSIINEYFNGIYDLQYKNSDFVNNLFGYLEKNKKRILEIIEIDSFLLYIEKLGEFDKKHKEKYRKFAIEVLLKHLKSIFDNKQYEYFDTEIINKMNGFDDQIKDLYNELMYEKEFFKIYTAEGIIENILMSKSPIPEVLSSKIKSEDLEKYCYANKDFVYSAVKFLRSDRHPEADELKDKILKVFEKISKNGNESQRCKMGLILEYLNNKDC
jgi:hypothetical protein